MAKENPERTNVKGKFESWKPGCSILACLLLGACSATTQPSKFYLLHSLSSSEKPVSTAPSGLAVGVGPVEIPEYVDRPQIVTRINENELRLTEFHKWVEPLKDTIPHVLADNLSVLMRTDRVTVYPWKHSTAIDYQVTIDITRFDASPDADAHLVAKWRVFGQNTQKVLALKKAHVKAPVKGTDYDSIVSALNQTVADLSRAVATSIGRVHSTLKADQRHREKRG